MPTRHRTFSRVLLHSIIAAHLLAVSCAAGGAAAVSFNEVRPGHERIPFAIPAIPEAGRSWREQVDSFGARVSNAFGVRKTTATEFAGWILEASARQTIEPDLLASLVQTESSFRKNVRSHIGAVGPAQVRPEYWSGFCGSSDLKDPAENIYCGAQILSHYRDRCGNDMECALQAYNIGPYSKRKQAGRRYVSKVDGYRATLRNHAG
jgi:soluble lytic murein transglycosylase-like protein